MDLPIKFKPGMATLNKKSEMYSNCINKKRCPSVQRDDLDKDQDAKPTLDYLLFRVYLYSYDSVSDDCTSPNNVYEILKYKNSNIFISFKNSVDIAII